MVKGTKGASRQMMDRRFLLKLGGFVAVAGALGQLPRASAPVRPALPELREPGTYQLTGRVRLQAPVVDISGITNAQQISWVGPGGAPAPVASFTSFETFTAPWRMPAIKVRGGELEALAVVPINFSS